MPQLADPDAVLDEHGIMALADLQDAFSDESTDRLPSRVADNCLSWILGWIPQTDLLDINFEVQQ